MPNFDMDPLKSTSAPRFLPPPMQPPIRLDAATRQAIAFERIAAALERIASASERRNKR